MNTEVEREHPASATVAELGQLGSEFSALVSKLKNLTEQEIERRRADQGSMPLTATDVRSVIRARRMRDEVIGAGLFADPGWDIMLDLLAAQLEGRPVPVASLCVAAGVPPTTALRWIKTLSDRGYLVRTVDPEDGRRVHLELSDWAAKRIEKYFDRARDIQFLLL